MIFLGFRWRDTGFEWERFATTFRELQWPWVAAATFFALLTYPGRALRWKVLIRGVKPDAGTWALTKWTTIGFAAIFFFGRAGELVRPYLISTREGVSFSSQVAAWVLERLCDMLLALLLFGAALTLVEASGLVPGSKLSWVLETGGYSAGALALICLGVLVVFALWGEAMERRLLDALAFLSDDLVARAASITSAFRQGMEAHGRPGAAFLLVFYSFGEWVLIVASCQCLFRGYPPTQHLGLAETVIYVGFAIFGSLIQIPGVGGGAQVVSVIVLTEVFGLPIEPASGAALLLWGISVLAVVPLGSVLALAEGLNLRKLRSIEEEEVHL